MRNKKILIEEISRMRSMMGLNENFIPKLLLESVSPARIRALFLDLIGATDNASRRAIINNMTQDEIKVFDEFLADPSIAKYFGGVRTIKQFADANVGRELLKLAKVLATNSADFAKKAGKNINFASSIDNLAKVEKELDNLKPSVAGLADDIDPNTDYGKLISSITSKKYDEIDTQVFNDFYSYLDDLKTKTTDPGVQNYLNDVQTDMVNIADEVDDLTKTKGFAGENTSIKIEGGDAGEYIDNVGQLVDKNGTVIKKDPLDGSPIRDGGFPKEKTDADIAREKNRQDLEAQDKLNKDIKEIQDFIKGKRDYKNLQKWFKFWPSEFQKDVLLEFSRLEAKVRKGEISLKELEDEALEKLKEIKQQRQDELDLKKRQEDAQTDNWLSRKLKQSGPITKIFWGAVIAALLYFGAFKGFYEGFKENNFDSELDECFETVPGWNDLEDEEKDKFANLGFGCENRKADTAPDKFITNIKFMEANPVAGTSEKFELVIGGKTETFTTSGVKSTTPTTGGSITELKDINALVNSIAEYKNVKLQSFTFVNKTGDIETYSLTAVGGSGGTLKYNTVTKAVEIS